MPAYMAAPAVNKTAEALPSDRSLSSRMSTIGLAVAGHAAPRR